MYDCGVCNSDGSTKSNCPVWNGEFENLLIMNHTPNNNPLEMEITVGESQGVTAVKPAKKFIED